MRVCKGAALRATVQTGRSRPTQHARGFKETLAVLPDTPPVWATSAPRPAAGVAPQVGHAAVAGLVAAGELVVATDRSWAAAGGAYAQLRVDAERRFRLGELNHDEYLDARLRADRLLHVDYPAQELLDALQKQALKGLGAKAERRLRRSSYGCFAQWCARFVPPDVHSTIPVASLVELRDSYRRFAAGIPVSALAPQKLPRKQGRTPAVWRLQLLHGVPPPSPTAVELVHQRLHAGRRLWRAGRLLDIGSGSGVITELLRSRGIGRRRTVCTDSSLECVETTQISLRLGPKRSREVVHVPGGGAAPVPTPEQVEGEFDLILHVLPSAMSDPGEMVEQGRVPLPREEDLLAVLRGADRLLAKHGRVALVVDNLSALVGAPSAVDVLMQTMEGVAQHNFIVDAAWDRSYDPDASLEMPFGPGMGLSLSTALKRNTGFQHPAPRPIPPGPLQLQTELDAVRDRVLYAGREGPLRRKRLTRNQIVRLNSQPYRPLQDRPLQQLHEDTVRPQLRTRLLLLRRKADLGPFRSVDFGQPRPKDFGEVDDDEEGDEDDDDD
eukprot:TRINITY_DN72023_c0_g1_i1.p2 TRINITY_DN72023_c0_g1~~TRINITY_DN72023_c0_g1_i1.p2  ORF type:complete len:554 (+),score=142.22 TRINITY_DN72023_c0_g1_i1:83-1744(+)